MSSAASCEKGDMAFPVTDNKRKHMPISEHSAAPAALPATGGGLRICRYTPALRQDFVRLNREWIERYFKIEPCDTETLGHPEETVLAHGGEIFFALADGKAVGCCALIHHPGDGRWELAKMAVSPAAQGHGIGYRLGTALFDYARATGVKKLFLEANTRLDASVRLYRRLGFVPVEGHTAAYARCDLYMEADLHTARPAQGRTARPTAVLISGGADSAVATHLLCERGLKPDLFYIKIGMEGEGMTCTAEEDIELSQATARRYGLRLEVIDLQREYHDRVVAYLVDRVRRGLTPNPDVMCNRLIKFGAFEEKAGYAYGRIVTGHYARVLREPDGQVWLAPSPDPVKDQSAFLAQLEDFQIEKLELPIGHLHKDEVRRIAAGERLAAARRHDSQGICFLGKINYPDFLRQLLGEREGPVVELETGKTVGAHKGYWFHTIGQRKGLGLGGGPWFVVKKDIGRNIIYVSHGYDTRRQYGRTFRMAGFHFLTGDPWNGSGEADIQF